MSDPYLFEPEWLALAAFALLVAGAVFMSLATMDDNTFAKRLSLGLGVACVLGAVFASALFVAYPLEPAGYETFQPAFDCVRRAGE
jgi:drug/metabolite transporter (DMT)-like permease